MIKVRRYGKGEAEALRKICIETTLLINIEEYGPELVQKWVKRLDDKKAWKQHVRAKNPIVAVNDNQIVGFAELDSSGKIGALYSHHEWQQRGVGTALLDRIEVEAKLLGIERLRVESSLSASRFFQAKGFEPVRENEVYTDVIPSRSVELVKATGDQDRLSARPGSGY